MNRPAEPWVGTTTGAGISILEPQRNQFTLRDTAESLAKVCRYNGFTPTHYSVAQHSRIVMGLLPTRAKPYGLLHDGHEQVVGDITSPMKKALLQKFGADIRDITDPIDAELFPAFGLQWPMTKEIADMVHHADMVAYATECRDIIPDTSLWAKPKHAPANRVITPWPWATALEKFIEAAEGLAAQGLLRIPEADQ